MRRRRLGDDRRERICEPIGGSKREEGTADVVADRRLLVKVEAIAERLADEFARDRGITIDQQWGPGVVVGQADGCWDDLGR